MRDICDFRGVCRPGIRPDSAHLLRDHARGDPTAAAGRAFSFVSKGGAGGPFDHVLLVASALADREFARSRIERTEGGRRETTTFGDGMGDIRSPSSSTPAVRRDYD